MSRKLRVRWSRLADLDLQAAHTFLFEKNPEAARRLAADILHAVDRLQRAFRNWERSPASSPLRDGIGTGPAAITGSSTGLTRRRSGFCGSGMPGETQTTSYRSDGSKAGVTGAAAARDAVHQGTPLVPGGIALVPYGTAAAPHGTVALHHGIAGLHPGTGAVPHGAAAVHPGTGAVQQGTRPVPGCTGGEENPSPSLPCCAGEGATALPRLRVIKAGLPLSRDGHARGTGRGGRGDEGSACANILRLRFN